MQTVRVQDTPQENIVKTAASVLKQGGLVIFPTETVYGAGVDATNPEAVAKLLSYKSRREGKPLSIAVTDQEMAGHYVELNKQAKTLYRQFMPGPITIVSKSKGMVAEGVASEFGTLGTRIPDYRLVLEIVRAFGKPITATSANASGKKRPYTISDILSNISEKQKGLIDLIIDAGTLPKNEPSTVIDTTLSTPVTLRGGELSQRALVTSETADLSLLSVSEQETMDIAGRLLLKHWDAVQEHGLVFGLEGLLGAGKTVFAKGIAQSLKIPENISSPTYSYIEEYEFKRHETVGKFFHLDMWKVDTEEDLGRLQVKNLLGPNNIVVIEWFSQIEPWLMPVVKEKKTQLISVQFEDTDSNTSRTLLIQEK